MDPLKVRTKFQVSSISIEWDIKRKESKEWVKKNRGAGQKKGSKYVPMDPPKVRTKFQVSSISIDQDI